jgi:hypothetical protein
MRAGLYGGVVDRHRAGGRSYKHRYVALGFRLTTLHKAACTLLLADAGLGIWGILVGGGMDSPFLLYALLPVLPAALLMSRRLSVPLAVVPTKTT